MTYQHIEIAPVAGALGAEISGVDMATPLEGPVFDELHDALMHHQVIFLRDQDITPAQHVAFAARFGHLQVHPFLPNLPDHPEVLILESSGANRAAANAWHSDVTFNQEPPLGSVLLAREVPEHGGDTMWANMYDAYDALSEPMKTYLGGMRAEHSTKAARFGKFHKDKASNENAEQDRQGVEPVVHPVIRTHPVTGRKALFVNSVFTNRLLGVSRQESRAILDYLFEHLTRPEFCCRFRWQKNSVAFWDNRCTQHYAIADYGDSHRLMHRVTIDGDRPV